MANFQQNNFAGSKWKTDRWETCGTFLRGRTGANSVLNKDKISVHFPSTLNIIATYFLHWGGATFPSSRSLLSSAIVFYKSDIINQTLAEAHSQRSKAKYEVAGQIWKRGGLVV